MFLYPAVCKHHTNSLRGYRFSSGGQARIAVVAGFGGARLLTSSLRFASPAEVVFASLRRPRPSPLRFAGRGRLRFASPRRGRLAPLRGGEAATAARARGSASARLSVSARLPPRHFQLLRSAGFPACGFRRLSSRLFRENETRDKNVPQTRRQECLRYIKVGTALASLRRVDAMSLPGRDVPTNKKRAAPKSGSCEEEITKTTCLIRPFCGGTARDRDRPTRPTPASWVPEHQPPRMTSNQAH